MKKTTIIIFTFILLTSNQVKLLGSDNTLKKKQKAGGWQLLFDGKTLDGWSVKSGFAAYKVEDGTIVGTTTAGSPNTFLCSAGEFSDFELTFEVKFDGQFFNSGVQIRSKLRGELYGGRVYGPQVEIEQSPGQSGFIYGEAAGAWQSPEPKSKDEAVNSHSYFQNDGWNKYRILAVGPKIQTWINGNLVADLMYEEGRYMDNSQGFIGLQVHGIGKSTEQIDVHWKNIYIRPIEAAERERGCVSLFNGKDFEGWKFHLGEEGADNNGSMTIMDGVIHCTGEPRGYMYTGKNYSNYILSYEWAFERPDDLRADSLFRGNSGCLVHLGKENALGVWPVCIEVQGQNRQAGLILPIPRSIRCERTYDQKVRDNAINPVGEWNTTTIDVNGGEMKVRINGMEVSTVWDCELTSGPIGFQSEGAPINWKNIRILER